MKVALVHDYLTEFGGAERVLCALKEVFPEAPIYTSLAKSEVIDDLKSRISKLKTTSQNSKLEPKTSGQQPDAGWDIRTPKLPKLLKRLSKAATCLMPLVFESFNLREYDVIISDGTIWSKGVLTRPGQLHIFYCHTPPRFLYGYPGEIDRRHSLIGPLLRPVDHLLRLWDFASAQRPDVIVANSRNVARRIRKFWGREADAVIYPPVASRTACDANARHVVRSEQGGYLLFVGRLSAYKNVDIAIKACAELELPLKIAGTGREEARLRKLAGSTAEFLGFVGDEKLAELYRGCRAVIFPVSDEDFGIVPVEAMSYGKLVIALRQAQCESFGGSGVEETVIDGKTGLFFDEPTAESLIDALKRLDTLVYRSEDCIAQAQKFSKEQFKTEIQELVGKHYARVT